MGAVWELCLIQSLEVEKQLSRNESSTLLMHMLLYRSSMIRSLHMTLLHPLICRSLTSRSSLSSLFSSWSSQWTCKRNILKSMPGMKEWDMQVSMLSIATRSTWEHMKSSFLYLLHTWRRRKRRLFSTQTQSQMLLDLWRHCSILLLQANSGLKTLIFSRENKSKRLIPVLTPWDKSPPWCLETKWWMKVTQLWDS